MVAGINSSTAIAETEEQVLETILKGVQYNESFVKSAVVDFNFEYYSQRPLSASDKNSYCYKGQARCFIKGDRMRRDSDYSATIFSGPVDPRIGGKKKLEYRMIESKYVLPNSIQTIMRKEKQLRVEESANTYEPIFPFVFGLNWSQSNQPLFKVIKFSDIIAKRLKAGDMKIAGMEEIEGSKCYVLAVPILNSNGGFLKYCVDPSKGFAVVKMTASEVLQEEGKKERMESTAIERICAVKKIDDKVWLPVSGVEKYYIFDPATAQTLSDVKIYTEREFRMNVTDWILNNVTDKDVTVPSIISGEYNSMFDVNAKVFYPWSKRTQSLL